MNNVAVLMSTYNGSKYLREQIDSILRQEDANIHLFIRDDGSRDDTTRIIDEYINGNDSIHLILGENIGVGRSFMQLVYDTPNDYDYYAFSDQDDIWTDDKVQVMMKGLSNNLLVQCQLSPFGANKESECGLRIDKIKGFWTNLYMLPFAGCCMAFKRSLLEVTLPFPKGITAHDAWIGMVGVVSGRYCFIENKCQLYRLHNDNVSGISKSSNSLWFKISYRWNILKNILQRRKMLNKIRT